MQTGVFVAANARAQSVVSFRIYEHHGSGINACKHVLVWVLAFVLWKTLEMRQSRSGFGISPRGILA